MKSSQFIDRDFDLRGTLDESSHQKAKAFLIEEVKKELHSDKNNIAYRCELDDVLKVLANVDITGNEAGAGVYQSFASTEIENAIKRVASGQHIDYLIYRHQWHSHPDDFIVRSFPIHLGIESTSACNMKCKMCFQSDPEFYQDRKNIGFMEFNLFKKVVDEGVLKGLKSIKLSIRGEPLLHPELVQMVDYARKQGVLDVMLNTNASCLTTDKSRELLNAEPTLLIFSIDSMNKNRFENIRKGADFDAIINNIEKFLLIKKNEFPASLTKTRLQMTFIPETIDDIDEVRKYWTDKVDEVAIKKALTRAYAEPVDSTNPCRILWQRLDIRWDGDVCLCDNDYKGELVLGNVRTQSVEEIWNSRQMNHLREKHRLFERNTISPCKYCDGL